MNKIMDVGEGSRGQVYQFGYIGEIFGKVD